MANIHNNITTNKSSRSIIGDLSVFSRIATFKKKTNTNVPGDITTNADMPSDVTDETNDSDLELPSSVETVAREDIISLCHWRFDVTPKDEQIQVVESIGRGDDCILIAGCGWGKSLAYFLSREIWFDKIILVISPLKSSIYDQQVKLRKTWNRDVALVDDNHTKIEDLARGRFNIVFMTPELIFNSKSVDSLWDQAGWQQRLQAVILADAHCISACSDFRPPYDRVGELRSRVGPKVAFVAVSATLTPKALQDVKKNASFKEEVTVINVGSDRPNVRLEVRPIENCRSFKELGFLKDSLLKDEKAIVYFNNISGLYGAWDYLQEALPKNLRGKMDKCTSHTPEDYKKGMLEAFTDGQILLLLSTEAAGVGLDTSDVIHVVQFGAPKTILDLVWRLGRAAHNPHLKGNGILLMPKFPETEFSDKDLYKFITTKTCRRKVLNEVFGNKDLPNKNCCDICHPLQRAPISLPDVVFKESPTKYRTQDQKNLAKAEIRKWRSEVFKNDLLKRCAFIPEDCLMTEYTVEKLGNDFAKVTGPKSFRSIIGDWTPLDPKYGVDLANILIDLNKKIEAEAAQFKEDGGINPDMDDPELEEVVTECINPDMDDPELEEVVTELLETLKEGLRYSDRIVRSPEVVKGLREIVQMFNSLPRKTSTSGNESRKQQHC